MMNITNGRGVEPVRGELGATILGPRNPAVEAQNPTSMAAPLTDAGTVPNLKFSYSQSHNRVLTGGWAREVTTRELPIAVAMAGVDMRLKPGAIRELHWHKEAEWAYMIAGSARVTLIDAEGRNFIDDLGAGDLWYFPAGLPHSIQALQDGCEFLLVFDDGNFSENETFLLCDWMAHTPRDVLAQNFGVDAAAFDPIPLDYEHSRYVFGADVPPALDGDRVVSPQGGTAAVYTHRMTAQEPIEVAGGRVRITDSTNFPVARNLAAALVEVDPGGLRELHWHPTGDEWQYYLRGKGTMGVFASGGKNRTFDYQAGDVGYVPFAMGHYIKNTGDEPLVFLEMFRSDRFADFSLNQWLGLVPPELVKAHLGIDDATLAALSKTKPVIAA